MNPITLVKRALEAREHAQRTAALAVRVTAQQVKPVVHIINGEVLLPRPTIKRMA